MKLCTMHNILVAYSEFLPWVAGNQATRVSVRICWEGGGKVRGRRQLAEEAPP